MKKLSLFLLVFIGLGACCGDIEKHWEIADFSVSLVNPNYEQIKADTTTAERMGISIDFDANFVAQNNPFSTKAYATTCPKSGNEGLVDVITSIEISSNEAYNNFAANSNLSNILTAFNTTTNVTEYINQQATSSFPYMGNYVFYFTERPTNNKTHTFTVTINFESGESVQRQSQTITWE